MSETNAGSCGFPRAAPHPEVRDEGSSGGDHGMRCHAPAGGRSGPAGTFLKRRTATCGRLVKQVIVATCIVTAALSPARAADDASAAAPTPKRPRIGLVLSGGGARGAAHIGVLKVLEEMRIPIDYIAGTSMGSIVGGSYASGTTIADMQQMLHTITTTDLVRDKLPREDQSMQRKKEDAELFIGPELGFSDGELRFPKGAVAGVRLEGLLRQLSNTKGFRRFDDLPIPFRAVATDLVNGQTVVLSEGELPAVMRASMSVPGVFAPVQLDGRTLVDGGVTRNVPVDVARNMGADVIIAVNLGTPLMKQDDITSLLGVTTQMINIMKDQNVQASLASLRPDDVLISPELADYSAADFDHLETLIPLGEAATRKVADKLARYALPPDQYAALRARQVAISLPDTRVIDAIRFEGLERANPKVLAASMDTKVGVALDPKVLDSDIRRLYGQGDFEHIGYRLIEEQGHHVLSVEALEKSWGPDYLRFGLALVTDFQSEAYFNVGASYRKHWLNSLGGELRVDTQLGYVTRLATELYQPLDATGHFFVAPYLQAERRPLDLYAGPDRIARFIFATNDVGADVGATFSKWGEVRLGVDHRLVRSSLDTGLPIFTNDHVEQQALRARFQFDQLDNLDFPHRGAAIGASLFNARGGDTGTYTKYQADAQAAYTVGPHTLQFGAEAAGASSGTLPDFDLIQFGGFQQLSGYRTGQLLGQKLTFARLVYLYRWREQRLLDGIYLGASLEAGHMDHVSITGSPTGLLAGASVFLGLDTPLGPLYLAYGHTKDGNGSAYLFLGRP